MDKREVFSLFDLFIASLLTLAVGFCAGATCVGKLGGLLAALGW